MHVFKWAVSAGCILTLTGCGWFRTDLPVRHGPQTEHHVTYANCIEIEGTDPC